MNLGLITPNPSDVLSFYRAWGVWAYLSKENGVNLIHGPEWDWHMVAQCDCVFMHRPWTSDHRSVAETCGAMKVPLWLDFDDNLLALERSNKHYEQFMGPATQAHIRRMCDLSSVITVSTEAMRMTYGKEANVIPNAFNDYVWKFQEEESRKVISWRGGATHHADMAPFLPAIERVAKEFSDWDWHFFGYPHWEIDRIIPTDQLHHHQWNGLSTYMWDLAHTKPAIHIVPLEDNVFNRCKSNLAWIEATCAGATTLGPRWEEWDGRGGFTFSDSESFEYVLRSLISKPESRQSGLNKSRETISENLLLSNVNQRRMEILHAVTSHETAS